MPTYKTKDGRDYSLPEVGHTVDGKITVPRGVVIENPNFELIEEAPVQAPVQAAQPAAPAAPVVAPAQTETKETN